MAYSPIDQGALAAMRHWRKLAERLGVTRGAARAGLGAVAQPGVVAIPKAVREAHLRENLAAAELQLSAEDLAEIDRLHPPPRRKRPLAMI